MNNERATSTRLDIDRKLIGVLSLFTILGVCLLVIIIVVSDTLSAMRAYSTLQTNWTEKRKEASFILVEYLQQPNEAVMNHFYEALEFIDTATLIREELLKEDTEWETTRNRLIQVQIPSYDVEDMITTFERFHMFPDFVRAINAWIESDRLINEMKALAEEARVMVAENPNAYFNQDLQFINHVRALDKQMTQVQYDLAFALAEGSKFLTRIVLLISTSLGLILLLIGSTFTVRYMKSLKEWGRELAISEQRYRSIYEQNPNAVFSLTTAGQIIDVNKAMERITGYNSDRLSDIDADRLIIPEQREAAQELFKRAIQSHPQSFETKWIRATGETLPLYLTYLPIYVDEEIVGVFGIADDISYIKHIENQLKDQLYEKTVLLAEVHDRVKNNLALISSLLQLQQEVEDDINTHKKLESTKARIHSMAMVHERLYHVESFSDIRMDEYVRELVKSNRKTFGSDKDKEISHVLIQADPITLDVKRAIPCGILLNELIVNAFKFGITRHPDSRLVIQLKRDRNNIFIQVKDNGIGLGKDFNIYKQNSLGMILIRTLAKQLNGSLEIKGEKGTEVTLVFQSNDRNKCEVLHSA